MSARVTRPPDRRRLLGLAVVLGLLAAATLLWQRPDPLADHTTVRAIVDDASGLAPVGAEVRVAGTKVGVVEGRRRVGDDAELELRLDGDRVGEVHRDATAALRPRLAFEGTAYVDLTPGSPGAPALGGRPIPRAQTTTYVPLADVLTILDRDGSRALQGTLAGLRDTLTAPAPDALGRTLRTAPGLTATLGRTARAARGPHAVELRGAVRGFAATARAVAARPADLPALTDDTATTARALQTAGGAPLDAALARLPATTRRLQTGGRALARTVRTLQPLARDLRPGARALTPALRTTRPLLRQASPTLRHATPVLADLRSGLDSARGAARPTRQVLHALTPTLNTLDGSLLGALERKTTLGTPAYVAFLGLFAGGGGASAPFDQDGHFMRFGFRFLTGLGLPLPPCALLQSAAPAVGQVLESAGACTP
jgi:phospholipid/cholesterol/gamma-HCH transport system substrate-binding protein